MPLSAEEQQLLEDTRSDFNRLNVNPAVDAVDRMSRVNPDQAAEDIRLSEENGYPIEVVEENREELRRRERLRALDLDELPKRSPITADWLSDEKNAVVAQDDLPTLEKLEADFRERSHVSARDVAQELPAGALEGVGMGVSGVGQLYDAYSRRVNEIFHSKEVGDFLFGEEANRRAGEQLSTFLDFGRSLKWAGGNIKQTADMIDLTEDERRGLSYWQNVGVDTVRGTGQLAGQVLTYMLNPMVGTGQLVGQGADQAAERQIQSGTLGKDWRSDLGILTGAGITYATEKVGIDVLLNRLPPQIKSRLLRNITDIAVAGGAEAIQEVVEGILHGINEYATSNPEAKVFEGLDREALAAGGSAMIFRALLNGLAPGRQGMTPVNADLRESFRQVKSTEMQDALDNRIHLAQQSTVNKRAKKQFAEFIEKAGPDEYVYIRPDVLTDMEGLPDNIVNQLDGTGANVSIPMKQFLTEIATDGAKLEAMRPHITLRDGDLTQDELEQAGETVPEHVQRLVANAQKYEDDLVEAEQIYEDVKSQLVETRRQGELTARMSAQLIPSMIVAQKAELAKMGKEVSVSELYEDMGLTIVGPEPDFDNRRVYEQDMYVLTEGKVGFKDDRIDFILRENAYADGRTKGAVAYINPSQFIGATTPSEVQQDMVRAEVEPLDPGRIEREIQTPFVYVRQDEETGEWAVDGHEGRHRMQALANAGYNQVPVILKFEGPVNELPPELGEAAMLLGDTWSGKSAAPIEIYGATPLTFKNRDRIAGEFGIGAAPQLMFQRDQEFEGNEEFEQRWEEQHKRVEIVEALQKCLKSS